MASEMEYILNEYKTKEDFDKLWKEDYRPVTYAHVRKPFEEYVKKMDRHIFLSDYEANGCIREVDFMENLTEDAQFFFQDTFSEIFYDLNPDLYEIAFMLYETAQLEQNPSLDVADTFHQEYNRLYKEFMLLLFKTFY